jgi:predicted phosphodiesterase
MHILILSDIHANFPALAAVDSHFNRQSFDLILNAGDSLVYGPYPNETLAWLQRKKAVSILGNTDKKVLKLLAGKSFKKPSKPEKRIMYTWTAEVLNKQYTDYLRSIQTTLQIQPEPKEILPLIALFHGSPEDDDEFLFPDTPDTRLVELAKKTPAAIVITGHSHRPFHRLVNRTHFINPGSVGRMFDGNPTASCAVLSLTSDGVEVEHYRIPYSINLVIEGIRENNLPKIYEKMFRIGRKLN